MDMPITKTTRYSLGILTLMLSLWGNSLKAQKGVGTNNSHPSAALEVDAPDKGILIPHIHLTAFNNFAPITGTASSSHNGLLVYNTNTSTTNGLNGEGFYYWSGGATGLWTPIQ